MTETHPWSHCTFYVVRVVSNKNNTNNKYWIFYNFKDRDHNNKQMFPFNVGIL